MACWNRDIENVWFNRLYENSVLYLRKTNKSQRNKLELQVMIDYYQSKIEGIVEMNDFQNSEGLLPSSK